MAKKRYVGFKYESIDDTTPVFDAKGIETVRRDGVLAQRKMVENCLKSEIRYYLMFNNNQICQNFISHAGPQRSQGLLLPFLDEVTG